MRCALAAVLTSTVALAEPADREAAEAAFRVGLQAFRANQFSTAARLFEEAYARDPRPETAFSIAQANRLQYYLDRVPWRVQRAVQLYQAYLDKLPTGPRMRDAADRLGELESVLRELRQRGELTPYVAPVRTELVIGADVDQASVTIDGQATGLWTPVAVAPGTHEIVVEAPGYEVARRRVQITPGRFLPIDVVLTAKPARLDIRGDSGATVYLDGRRLGALPAAARVPAGAHFLSVTRRGRQTWNRELVIGRDETLVVRPALEDTVQRRAARWVLLGAGATALVAGGIGVTAYLAHRDAEALDEKRRALEATPDDIRRYNDRLDDERTRTRIALGVGIGAAAVGIVGASLWWFDRPNPGARIAPVVTPDTVGAGIEARF